MFDDLIKPKEQEIHIQNANPNICPFCKGTSIIQYDISENIDHSYEREAECRVCFQRWRIIYDKSMGGAIIIC